MERVLSIYLPAWDVQLLQRLPSAPPNPLVLVAMYARQQMVVRCCARAAGAGVSPGLTLAEARALCPAARVLPFDADKSVRGLTLLAHWCHRFSPAVAVDPTPFPPPSLPPSPPSLTPSFDGLLLDITGEAHLFGSEKILLYEIAARLQKLGFTARLAAAPTLGAAWALARCAPEAMCVLELSCLRKVVEPLPLLALRLSVDIRERLSRVGLRTIGHLLDIPRESLLTRFGPELLLRMDQLLGRAAESFEAIHEDAFLEVRRAFDGAAIQIQAITLTVQSLLEELCDLLLQRESGVRGLTVELTRINAAAVSRQILLSRPSRDPKHLWSLLRAKVEGFHLGFGVEVVTLRATWVEKILHQQMPAFDDPGSASRETDGHVAQLLDTLLNRWGPKRIFRAMPVDSHLPERARQFEAVCASKSVDAGRPGGGPLFFLDRPSLLLDRPEPAEAMALIPDHPPAWLRWRAQEHSLRTGVGPERIVTTWWTPSPRLTVMPSTRDYFKVQNSEGLWLWVFRELETGRWFVHGLWV